MHVLLGEQIGERELLARPTHYMVVLGGFATAEIDPNTRDDTCMKLVVDKTRLLTTTRHVDAPLLFVARVLGVDIHYLDEEPAADAQ